MLSCVYHAYDGGELVATGRLTFDDLPRVGEEVRLNGRRLVVRAVEFRGGEHVVQLAPA
ncbi:MAG TPA: hypothetical protein VGN27_04795 [Gaiellaceae bacterium]|jgi:hypothetical protein|nr:hypothetical protein [Gaiellaceae bacterium]